MIAYLVTTINLIFIEEIITVTALWRLQERDAHYLETWVLIESSSIFSGFVANRLESWGHSWASIVHGHWTVMVSAEYSIRTRVYGRCSSVSSPRNGATRGLGLLVALIYLSYRNLV